MGSRGNANLQASVAAGIESAGETGGAAGVLGIGIASNSIGLAGLQQTAGTATERTDGADSVLARLRTLKEAFEEGLITQEDYDIARAKALDT
jgi:membrane protease subunit (stomatin/prohibitin family)